MAKEVSVPEEQETKSAKKSAYAQAGVNIDVKMDAVGSIKQMVAKTKTANVLGNIGAFAGSSRSLQGATRFSSPPRTASARS